MARTAGSMSLGSVDFQEVLRVMGTDYKGKITVGAKWWASVNNGDEDVVFVRRETLPEAFVKNGEVVRPIEIENGWTPPQTVSESRPRKLGSWNDDDTA